MRRRSGIDHVYVSLLKILLKEGFSEFNLSIISNELMGVAEVVSYKIF